MSDVNDQYVYGKAPNASVSSSRLDWFLGALAFRIFLDICYVYYITDAYEHIGLSLYPVTLKIVESYLSLILLAYLSPPIGSRFSTLAFQFLLMMGMIPIQTYYAFSDGSREWFYLCLVFWILVGIGLRTPFSIRLKWTGHKLPLHLILPMFSVISLFAWLIVTSRFSLSFDLENVDEVRDLFMESSRGVLDYFLIWCGKVFIPLLIFQGLEVSRGKWRISLFFVAVLTELAMFSFSGHKVFLFNIPAVLGLRWLLYRKNFATSLSLVCCLLLAGGMLTSSMWDNPWINDLFARRTCIGPAQLSFYYFDFFEGKPLFLAATRIGSLFVDYPYPASPPYMIGLTYFGGENIGANNGITADGFMNFGTFGILIWAAMLCFLLKLADAVVYGRNPRVTYGILLLSLYTLIEGYLLTTLVTHGLLLAYLLAYLTPPERTKAANPGSFSSSERTRPDCFTQAETPV